MAVQSMDNVLIVIEDLDPFIAFFQELGLELMSNGPLNGLWVEHVVGLDDVRQHVAVLRTPDGRSGIELVRFTAPEAVRPEPAVPPVNTLGIRRVMFAVDDIDTTVAPLQRLGAGSPATTRPTFAMPNRCEHCVTRSPNAPRRLLRESLAAAVESTS